ncbi:MAG: NUDIX domain-containing protein [Bacteroidales bacterium]|nr:NUDIX domain-containing protein [Bacteroidales bacterium]
MYSIFFRKRALRICKIEDKILNPNSVIYSPGNDGSFSDLPELMDGETIHDLIIAVPENEYEATIKKVCSLFNEINAGGGVIENGGGDILFIKRDGIWDLPKGKQEKGEDIKDTAIREIKEETGCNATLKDLICITNHTYHRNDKFNLKHIYWFGMKTEKECELVPQTKEDITEAVWVAKAEIKDYADSTYPSVKEVLHSAGLL